MFVLLVPLVLLSPALSAVVLEPPPPPPASGAAPAEGWLTVRLNHFDASDTHTFRMRYYYNNEFATTSDVVIFVGGEWEISPGWVTGGLAHELARQTGAGLFYTEHRYFGQTRPTADTATAALRWLTVDQALADLAQFIQHAQSDQFEGGRFSGGRVSLVGCSYAGSVATWMRLAYPHLVTAALSDSGPLRAQEDFPEYLEVVTEALRTQGSEECVASIEEAVRSVVRELETETGASTVSRLFNTCSPINGSSELDVATFFWSGVTESFAHLVQHAAPGELAAACALLTDPGVSDPVTRLANWATAQPWARPCVESRYAQQLAAHTDTGYEAPRAVARLRRYRACVEFGWQRSTSGARQPFLATVPLEYFRRMCRDFFSDYFSESLLRSGIQRTNLLFGGLTHLPDRVVSVAGGHDPWSPMGPNSTHATPLAPVYVVPGVSHCRAIRSSGENETQQLGAVRRAVLRHMRELLAGAPPPPPAGAAPAAPAAPSPLRFTLVGALVYLIL